MIILKNRMASLILPVHFNALCIWPLLFIRPDANIDNFTATLNHERIHARQQLEMVWLFFFIWYVMEFLVRLMKQRDRLKAYQNLSHEKEAFLNEHDSGYLKKRKAYAWVGYL